MLCIVSGLSLTGQNDSIAEIYQTPFDKKGAWNYCAIKFKILPWISVPSGSGLNPSAGFEYGFSKNQSIGIDFYYNHYSFSAGDRYDSIQDHYVAKPRKLYRDKAIFINYRYYLNSHKLREKSGSCFYMGSFVRAGILNFKYEDGYVKTSSVTKEHHYSLGLMYGILHQIDVFKKDRQFNVDAYLGIYVKQKIQFIEYTNSDNLMIVDKDYPVGMGFRIGLTFSVTFKR